MIRDDYVAIEQPAGVTKPRRISMTRFALLAVLIGVIAGSAWALRQRQRAATAGAAATAAAAAGRVIPVLTTRVVQRDVPIWLEGLGSVSAFYTVMVKTQVDGRLDNVLFTEGGHVKKGDVLAQIDPRPFAIQLASAQAALGRDSANLKNARVNLDRYSTLAQQHLIAVQQSTDQQATVDQLDAQLHADQAQVDAARLNLDYARITSPIDGVTGVRLVDPGNVVHAADATGLVVVTQLDPIAVVFTLPEDDLPAIHQAMATVDLDVEALSREGGKTLASGKLTVVDNAINQATATARFKAIFPNPSQALWPNQFVRARVRLGTRERALVVPTAVVQHGPQETFAYVIGPDSTAAVRSIHVDATQGDDAVISGLSLGEEVVVNGQAQLRAGARVATKPANAPPAGSAHGAASPNRNDR